jgi:SseB protein N-terminal domain
LRPDADSGGVPWTGRELPPAPYASDDGRPDPDLAAALGSAACAPGGRAAVVRALGPARVFVAVVAQGRQVAEMALVRLDRPDGRRALPVFTSPDRLAQWHPQARPVPVTGRQAALSAVADGCDLMSLDPGSGSEHLVRRPAVWAVAQGRSWVPSYANPVVTEKISQLLAELELVGDSAPGESAELRVVLHLPVGLNAQRLEKLTADLSRALGASEIVAREVDSLEIVVRPV